MKQIKQTRHLSPLLRPLAFLAALSLCAATPALAQNQDVVQEKLQSLQAEIQTLNDAIYELQREANRSPEVREALINYGEVLTEEMKKIDPDNASLIDQRQATYKELLRLNTGEMTAEKEAQLQETGQQFNSIRQQLAKTEAQANETAEARVAMEGYNQAVMSKMTELDPQVEAKIEKRESLNNEFSGLREAIIRQQQQQTQ